MADNNESSGMSMVVGIIAIVAIILIAWFAMQFLSQGDAAPEAIDVNVDDVVPNPDVDLDPTE